MKTWLNKVVWSVGLAGCLVGAAANPGSAQIGVNIHLGPQPPPRREVYGRAPRHGCVWGRGHYVARGNRWVWIPGHWLCRGR
jgi:hypothetical protein